MWWKKNVCVCVCVCGRVPLIITSYRATQMQIRESTSCDAVNWSQVAWDSQSDSRGFSAWNRDFCTRTRISRLVRHWLPFERVVQHIPGGCVYTNCSGRNHCIIQDGLHLGEDYYWLIRSKRPRLGSRLVTGWFIGISVCSPLRCNEHTMPSSPRR